MDVEVMKKTMFSSEKQDWGTPPEFLDYLFNAFDWIPDLDAACSPHNMKAEYGICLETGGNGLEDRWFGNVWLNPPFGRELPKWIRKAWLECNFFENCDTVMMLIPARVDTKWFHEMVMRHATHVYLIKGRFNYLENGTSKAKNAPFPTMLVKFTAGSKGIYHRANINALEIPKEARGFSSGNKGGGVEDE